MKTFRKNLFLTLGLGILLIFILCYSDYAKQYAYLGLSVWFEQMIPSLLPFMILSSLLIKLNLDELLIKPIAGILRHLYHINDAGIYVLVMGFLCGFPMGAKTAAMEYEAGKLSRREAEFLLAFTNNIGPAYFLSFVYGSIYVAMPLYAGLFCLYGIPLLYGLFLRYTVYSDLPETDYHVEKRSTKKYSFLSALDESVEGGLFQIAMLGGYMVLCNLLVLIPKVLFSSHIWAGSFCHNLLEISGGLLAIKQSAPAPRAAFFFAHISLAFTGISCHLQTFHILGDTGLSKQKYMLHKLILCSIVGIVIYVWLRPF
ncbi:MAG: hypothetical protein J1E61_02175 [Lachnospiraceae bacterium]|nr:hypothetical protein [Lachnospiraceae bacterium]